MGQKLKSPLMAAMSALGRKADMEIRTVSVRL
jgi:hypothetical protein